MNKYIITGINRLTGTRECISRPMEEHQAQSIVDKIKKKRVKNRPFLRLKICSFG